MDILKLWFGPKSKTFTEKVIVKTYNRPEINRRKAERTLRAERGRIDTWCTALERALLQYSIQDPDRRLCKSLFPACCTLQELNVIRILIMGNSGNGKSLAVNRMMDLLGQDDRAMNFHGTEGTEIVADHNIIGESGQPNIVFRDTKGQGKGVTDADLVEAALHDKLRDGDVFTRANIQPAAGLFRNQCHAVFSVQSLHQVEVHDPRMLTRQVERMNALRGVLQDKGIVPITLLTHAASAPADPGLVRYLDVGSRLVNSAPCHTFAIESKEPMNDETSRRRKLRPLLIAALYEAIIHAEQEILNRELDQLRNTNPREAADQLPKYAMAAFLWQVADKYDWLEPRFEKLLENLWAAWRQRDMSFHGKHEFMTPKHFQMLMEWNASGEIDVFLSLGQRDQLLREFEEIKPVWRGFHWM